MDEKELKELMARENPEFRKIHEDHQTCEKALDELQKRGVFDEKDRLLEKELKKKKLALKDRMYIMMSEYRKST
jgi:uncharacterized protein YdcH (DUF465 family)